MLGRQTQGTDERADYSLGPSHRWLYQGFEPYRWLDTGFSTSSKPRDRYTESFMLLLSVIWCHTKCLTIEFNSIAMVQPCKVMQSGTNPHSTDPKEDPVMRWTDTMWPIHDHQGPNQTLKPWSLWRTPLSAVGHLDHAKQENILVKPQTFKITIAIKKHCIVPKRTGLFIIHIFLKESKSSQVNAKGQEAALVHESYPARTYTSVSAVV